jgi:hypothetical protein
MAEHIFETSKVRPLRVVVQDQGNALVLERGVSEAPPDQRGDPVLMVTAPEIWPLIRALQLAAKRMHTYDAPESSAAELKVA